MYGIDKGVPMVYTVISMKNCENRKEE